MSKHPSENRRAIPKQAELAALQSRLLESVLTGRPLPGSEKPLRFPDLAFVINQPSVLILDENLAEPVTVKGAPKPVRILTQEELQKEAQQKGDVTYLEFAPPEIEDSAVRLTLHAKIAGTDPMRPMLGLGGTQVRFRLVNGEWQADDAPVLFAT